MTTVYAAIGRLVVQSVCSRYRSQIGIAAAVLAGAALLGAAAAYLSGGDGDDE